MIGRIVGNYKIIQALGEGGVGMVYKGVDTMLDREVAIKVLRPELASQTAVVERFRSEAVTLAKLSHPNIATLYSLFRDGQDLLMVLEFLKGETLDHTLYRRGRIPTDEAIPIFCQALEGINYAHNLGIVHRDIKPGNMMLTEDGTLKVLDFGIARLLGSTRMTRIGNVIGTLEYMSPEQVKGHETDARSDVYGLGIMLYEMLTGKLPFESENDFALMKMQTEDMPVPPRQLNPEIPFEVENAVLRSVSKDPEQRFQSAGEFLEYFLETGYAAPTGTFGFNSIFSKRISRPSKPGIRSVETSNEATLLLGNVQNEQTLPLANVQNEQTLQLSNIQTDKTLPLNNVQSEVTLPLVNVQTDSVPKPQSQIQTTPIISVPDIPATLEVGEELKKDKSPENGLTANQANIKGTRLASPLNQIEMKSTRLGVGETQNSGQDTEKNSTSFFVKLNWIHYTGAAVAGLFIFTLIGVAAVLPFVWKGNNTPAVEQKPVSNPGNSGAAPAPVSQPIAKEPSQKDVDVNSQIPSGSSANTNSTAIVNPPATSVNSSNPPPAQKRANETETAKTNSPPVRQQPKQQPRNSGNSGGESSRRNPPPESGSKEDAREVMTNAPKRKVDN